MKIVNLTDILNTKINVEHASIAHHKPANEVYEYKYPTNYSYFCYAIKGYASYLHNNRLIELYPNSLCYIPVNSLPYFSEDEEFEYIRIDFKIIEQESGEEILFSDTVDLIFSETPLSLYAEIKDFLLQIPLNNSYLKIYAKFMLLLDSIYHSLKNDNLDSSMNVQDKRLLPIAPALWFIQNSYKGSIVTKELAQMCHFSESYFRKIFKEVIGTSPTEYRNYLRINYACQQLHINYYNISSISDHSGFNTVHQFYKTFKSIIGISPSEYRKKVLYSSNIKTTEKVYRKGIDIWRQH